MVSNRLIAVGAAIAASSLVSAQTFAICNPLTSTCPPDPAVGNDAINCQWASGACSAFNLDPGTTLTYGSNGAVFSIDTQAQAPTIVSPKYIFFGRLDIEVQAAPGAGIVTAASLLSDDLDEIDLEWVGADNANVQSNYFSKGITGNYDRGAMHPVSNPLGSFHTYSVIWTSTSVQWLIDNNVVRTLTCAGLSGSYACPQTPMQVKVGTWVAGCSTCAPGTVSWAGGMASFAGGPALAYYKSIAVTDYAGGDGPTSNAVKEYIYGGDSGTWQSIEVVKGDGSGTNDNQDSSSSSAPPKTSSHATSSKPTSTSTTSTTTTSKTSSAKKTTSTTKSTIVTTPAHKKTTSAAPTHTPAKTSSTTSSAPATESTGAAAQGSVNFGALAVAGAGVLLAQLF